MNKQGLIETAASYVQNSADNIISKPLALSEAVEGMKIFEPPIFAFGAAEDEKFGILKDPEVIGEHFVLPKEWLPQAKTVVSFFLPFTDAVKKGNRRDMSWPTAEWLHGRIEGQTFINKLCQHLLAVLTNAGYKTVAPCIDERFWATTTFKNVSAYSDSRSTAKEFTSNWSERHVAFVCGLGTFGLSKGLITKKGIAGRFGSLITELGIIPDQIEYKDTYEFCSMCGSCVKNCPVNAISIDKGKDHKVCSSFLDKTAEKHKPRYGCGKCQIKVPCENGIPRKI